MTKNDNNNADVKAQVNGQTADGAAAPKIKKAPVKRIKGKWFVDTLNLCKQYNTNLIFTPDRRVMGFKAKSNASTVVHFPKDEEWIDYVLSAYPDGAAFPSFDSYSLISGGFDASMRSYAAVGKIGDTNDSVCWFDTVKGVVHLKNGTTKLSGLTVEAVGTIGLPPITSVTSGETELEPLDISSTFSDTQIKTLTSIVNGVDPTRTKLCQINRSSVGGKTGLVASDGRCILFVPCDGLPDFEYFGVPTTVVNFQHIARYTEIVERDTEKEENKTTGEHPIKRILRYFGMDDGCIVEIVYNGALETLGAIERVIGPDKDKRNFDFEVSGAELRGIFDECSKLNLFERNTIARFTNGTFSVLNSVGGETATFPLSAEMNEGDAFFFNPNLLAYGVVQGGDFGFAKKAPCYSKTDEGVIFLLMPLCLS